MKPDKNHFPQFTSFANLYLAFRAVCKGKRDRIVRLKTSEMF